MNTDVSDALRRAASIMDEIEGLEAKLRAILEGSAPRRGRKPGTGGENDAREDPAPTPKKRRKKRKHSSETLARMVAAAKARWAHVKKSRK